MNRDICPPQTFSGLPHKLFCQQRRRNLSRDVSVSKPASVPRRARNAGKGLGSAGLWT